MKLPNKPRKGYQSMRVYDDDTLQGLIDWATELKADPKEVRVDIEYGYGDDRDEYWLITTLPSDEETYDKRMKEYNSKMREYNKWKKEKKEEYERKEFERLKKKYDD